MCNGIAVIDKRIEKYEEMLAPLMEKTRSFIADFSDLVETYNRIDTINVLLGELKSIRATIKGG